ncbi:MauE/DoxX family redox-associated membrane protein [Paracoccus sp. 22332]|uniref:MauE/DoxX family redox-associated membrane protein n=1 Tax=Paracoccus sp. 22332 TaxID=3453913 RepID=UPI003F835DD9
MDLIDAPVLAVFVKSFLMLLFITAALSKLRNLDEFHGVVRNFRLMPDALARTVAYLLPPVEMATAIAIAVPATSQVATALAGALLLVFGAAMAINVLRGRSQIDCGCFRNGLKQPLSWGVVARNAALATAAFAAAAVPFAVPGGAGLVLGVVAGGLAMLIYVSATMLGGVSAALRDNPHLASKG